MSIYPPQPLTKRRSLGPSSNSHSTPQSRILSFSPPPKASSGMSASKLRALVQGLPTSSVPKKKIEERGPLERDRDRELEKMREKELRRDASASSDRRRTRSRSPLRVSTLQVKNLEYEIEQMKQEVEEMKRKELELASQSSKPSTSTRTKKGKVVPTSSVVDTLPEYHLAATLIQSAWRGHKTRKNIKPQLKNHKFSSIVATFAPRLDSLTDEVKKIQQKMTLQDHALRFLWERMKLMMNMVEEMKEQNEKKNDEKTDVDSTDVDGDTSVTSPRGAAPSVSVDPETLSSHISSWFQSQGQAMLQDMIQAQLNHTTKAMVPYAPAPTSNTLNSSMLSLSSTSGPLPHVLNPPPLESLIPTKSTFDPDAFFGAHHSSDEDSSSSSSSDEEESSSRSRRSRVSKSRPTTTSTSHSASTSTPSPAKPPLTHHASIIPLSPSQSRSRTPSPPPLIRQPSKAERLARQLSKLKIEERNADKEFEILKQKKLKREQLKTDSDDDEPTLPGDREGLEVEAMSDFTRTWQTLPAYTPRAQSYTATPAPTPAVNATFAPFPNASVANKNNTNINTNSNTANNTPVTPQTDSNSEELTLEVGAPGVVKFSKLIVDVIQAQELVSDGHQQLHPYAVLVFQGSRGETEQSDQTQPYWATSFCFEVDNECLFRALATSPSSSSSASEVTDNHIAITVLSKNPHSSPEDEEDIVIGSVVIPVIELQNQLQSTAWYPLHGRGNGGAPRATGMIQLSLLWLYNINKLVTDMSGRDPVEINAIFHGVDVNKLLVEVESASGLVFNPNQDRLHHLSMPYVTLTFQGINANTMEAKGSDMKNPHWNFNFTFDVNMSDALALYLAVYRTVDYKHQELLGVAVVDVNRLFDQQSRHIQCPLKQPGTDVNVGSLRLSLLWLHDLKQLVLNANRKSTARIPLPTKKI